MSAAAAVSNASSDPLHELGGAGVAKLMGVLGNVSHRDIKRFLRFGFLSTPGGSIPSPTRGHRR
jgi:hypothetical protein